MSKYLTLLFPPALFFIGVGCWFIILVATILENHI